MPSSRTKLKKMGDQFAMCAYIFSAMTMISTLINITISTLVYAYRWDCGAGMEGSFDFTTLLLKHYIQDASCNSQITFEGITTAHSVFIMVSLLMAFSIINLITSCAMIVATFRRIDCPYYVVVGTYVHACAYVAVVVIEITLSAHFMADFLFLSKKMVHPSADMTTTSIPIQLKGDFGQLRYFLSHSDHNKPFGGIKDQNPPGYPSNCSFDTMQQVSLLMMIVVMKGFMIQIVNIGLIPTLLTLVHKDTDRNPGAESPPHKIRILGTINAFDKSNNQDPSQFTSRRSSSSSLKSVRWNDYIRNPTLISNNNDNPAFEYDNGQRRSSWGPNRPSRFVSSQLPHYHTATRDRAYPGHPSKRPEPSLPTAAPADRAPLPPHQVPIPVPDYSPRPKLKSALKNTHV